MFVVSDALCRHSVEFHMIIKQSLYVVTGFDALDIFLSFDKLPPPFHDLWFSNYQIRSQ